MSSRSPPLVSSTEGDRLYMSRYSDATSDLARLRISSTSGDMKTRSQTEKERQRQSSSRAPAKSTRKAAGQSNPSAGSSRSQPARESMSKRQKSAPQQEGSSEDDDEDDDDDDSDDDDDDDDGPPATPAQQPSPAAVRRAKVLLIMSANDPSQLGPTEFANASAQDVPLRSRSYRRIAEVMATNYATDDNGFALLHRELPLDGAEWGGHIATNIETRMTNAWYRFQQPTVQSDALDTIREYRRIYDSVNGTLRHPLLRNMHNVSKTRLVYVLVQILNTIVNSNVDVRGPSAPVYAGGSGQNEHNLFQRFTRTEENWRYFLHQVLQPLAYFRDAANHFREQQVTNVLLATWKTLGERYPTIASYPNQSMQDFGFSFRTLLVNLGGECFAEAKS